MTDRNAIERDGYIVLRGLLTASEIARLRDVLLEHFADEWRWEGLGKHQPNAAVEIPAMAWLFFHPAIIATFRDLFGHEDLVFTGNCDAHMNMLSSWHKDTSEAQGGSLSGDYFARARCGVYRAGVYLQDHLENTHGLKVRKGSHHTRSLHEGEIVTLSTKAGDMIFFDLRLTHAGQFADPFEWLLLRGGRRLAREQVLVAIKDRYQRLLGKPQKLSTFFTYGMPCQDTTDFCRFEAAGKRAREKRDAFWLGADLARGLARTGISSPFCNATTV